jgi:hypothetical protein
VFKNLHVILFSVTGHVQEIHICEHAYLAALGYNSMPCQWRELKSLIMNPEGRDFENQRYKGKSDHCVAYIADFKERHCDFSAFAGYRMM